MLMMRRFSPIIAACVRIVQLFFVFENFIRDFVLETLSEFDKVNSWDRVPKGRSG
jgi:hypothetical protein